MSNKSFAEKGNGKDFFPVDSTLKVNIQNSNDPSVIPRGGVPFKIKGPIFMCPYVS